MLEVALFIPASSPWNEVDRGYKSAEQYWYDTGLNDTELVSMLSKEQCYQTQKSFLGCVNAIQLVAEKYKLIFKADGQLQSVSKSAFRSNVGSTSGSAAESGVATSSTADWSLTEKERLQVWKSVYESYESNMDHATESVTSTVPIQFLDLWKKLDSEFIKKEHRSAVIAQAMNAFYSVYYDPHTYLLPIDFYDEVVARADSRSQNYGFLVKRGSSRVIVRKVFEKSSAARAGLVKSDQILEMNGRSVKEFSTSEFYELLKAKDGSRLGLTILRHDSEGEHQVFIDIIKREDVLPTVSSQELNRKTQLITIHKFAKQTCELVRGELKQMSKAGKKGLVLDLRDNPGGQVDEASCVLSLFLPIGTKLFETRYSDQQRIPDVYFSQWAPVFKGPMAVLVNSATASAGEIVAGVLKDYSRATLVGERTFGKGSFQDGRLWELNNKVALFKTEGLYYFASGWTPQLVGLEPDIFVDNGVESAPREEDLYFSSIRPKDRWVGPQSLSWLKQMNCDPAALAASNASAAAETAKTSVATSASLDPQMKRAEVWLSCQKITAVDAKTSTARAVQ